MEPVLSESFERQHMERATEKLIRELATPQGEAILREQVHHQRGLQANLHSAWQKTRVAEVLKMLLSHFSDTSPTMHRDVFLDLTTKAGLALQEGLAAFQDIDVVKVNRIAALQLRNWCGRVDHPFNILHTQIKKPISLEELRSARDILVQLTAQEARVTARRRFEELRSSAVQLAHKKQKQKSDSNSGSETASSPTPPKPVLTDSMADEQSVTSAQKYLTIFQYFDRDGDGRLNLSEVNDFTALTEGEGAQPCSPSEWRDLCQSRCLDPNKGLALSDLIAIYESQQGDLNKDYVVVQSHIIRDTNNDTPTTTTSNTTTPTTTTTPATTPIPPSSLPAVEAGTSDSISWDTPGGRSGEQSGAPGGGSLVGFQGQNRRPWSTQLVDSVKVSRALEFLTLADDQRISNFLFEHEDACSSSMEWVSLVQANQNGFQNNMFEAMSSKMPNPSKGPLQCGATALDTQEWAEVGATIAAGAFNQIGPIVVLRVGAVMEWKFAVTEGKDIEFAILFTNGTYVPEPLLMTSNVGEGVQKSCRLRGVVRGSHTFQQEGMAFLRWSNSYSWMRSREVRYRVRLRHPPLHDNAAMLRRIRTEFEALVSRPPAVPVTTSPTTTSDPKDTVDQALVQRASHLRASLEDQRQRLARAKRQAQLLDRSLKLQSAMTVVAYLRAHETCFRELLGATDWDNVRSAFSAFHKLTEPPPSKAMVWETS